MKKCKECSLEIDDMSKFDVCFNCRQNSESEPSNELKEVPKKVGDTKPDNTSEDVDSPILGVNEHILNLMKKQTLLLTTQHRLQNRISNNLVFFFWITIIFIFIIPLMWIVFGLSVLL